MGQMPRRLQQPPGRNQSHQQCKRRMNGSMCVRRHATQGRSVIEDSSDELEGNCHQPPKLHENCLIKCFQCLKGSATYRNLRLKLSIDDHNSVSRIDQASRILFPLVFISFHVFYWMTYLNKDGMADMFYKK